jgi:hypothetical protein
MKLLKGKFHYHEIEVCHMSSLFRRIMNEFRRYMKLVEHFGNIGWKVHELACNLYEIKFALLQKTSYQRSMNQTTLVLQFHGIVIQNIIMYVLQN